LGTSCKGERVVLQMGLRKVLLLASLMRDAVNQIPGFAVFCEDNEEQKKLHVFMKISTRNLFVLPEVGEEGTWCPTGEKT